MKTILHVVVGAGIPLYMENAIQSVLAWTSDDVLGIYNFLNSKDQREAEDLKSKFEESRLTIQVKPNNVEVGVKTGSLYQAYNSAIEFATGRYDLIHFIQADMQMMYWDVGFPSALRALFDRQHDTALKRLICVGTSFHSRGRWTADYAKTNLIPAQGSQPSFVYCGVSMSDVGVFDLSELLRSKIRFEGTEAEMQDRLSHMGYEMNVLPIPVVSFVPWPVTVRDGKVVAQSRLGKYGELPLLKIRPGYPPPGLDQKRTLEVIWMEDWVYPNEWESLWPYWLSDTTSPKWLKRRLVSCRELGVGFLFRAGAPRRRASRRVPALFELFWGLLIWSQKRVSLALRSSLRQRFRGSFFL